MSERLVAFVDDARLLPDLSASPDVLVISLDSQAASDLAARTGLRVRSIGEYAESFESYDELYAHFRGEVRERFRPKDPQRQSRFLFEVLWDDILLSLTPTLYVETLILAVLQREKPARVVFAISDRALDALFRRIVEQRS